MTELRFSPQLRTHIASQLSGFDRQTTNREDLRKAAVAVVIAPCAQSTEASVLVTMRPEMLNRHGGQYALPGGRLDAGETDVQAALRELDEELGLRVAEKDVLGALDDFPTRSGFRIAPLVMWVDDLSHMRPDPGEVASVHHLTFSELSSPDIPRLTENDVGDHPVLSAYFPSLGHHIYAPTAAILYQFRQLAIRGEITRAAHFEQPAFAWK
ncbi:CoA pyrophosphatase [Aestuariivita sp.]|jgi:8-oxo-dGTP pyrophosphatase MutT (NUDIX family)|uniref:NUDIX hydrolase n=1 Tax=Aestuariivita sp. TaxID=1872407 RepID=UPI00217130D7|nr:CoA pyrophosphatase [Aestuariivita sp.]MCE8007460.1 CoA pyrophosphatase [Aestuariivita sp.]